jgi:exodeoxyribonuclease VII small subunit
MASSKPKKNELSFEDAFRKLETLVETLEKGENTLEESIRFFEEGMELVRFCSEKLNHAEIRLQQLIKKEDGGFQLELTE